MKVVLGLVLFAVGAAGCTAPAAPAVPAPVALAIDSGARAPEAVARPSDTRTPWNQRLDCKDFGIRIYNRAYVLESARDALREELEAQTDLPAGRYSVLDHRKNGRAYGFFEGDRLVAVVTVRRTPNGWGAETSSLCES